jgi:hypothetical protein
MAASTGSSLATVLMSVPLAAIPLMAIFGIPQFTEVVASPDNGREDLVVGPDADLGHPLNPASFRERSSDLPDNAPAFSSRDSSDVPLGNPFDLPAGSADDVSTELPPGQAAFRSEGAAGAMDGPRPSTRHGAVPGTGHSIDGDARSDGAVTPVPPVSGMQMTWRDATRRLEELGIDNYHLERGESFESYLFVCTFQPADTTNVTMRFEAEADEPLAAVSDVLNQIDRWLRRSFAESRQAALLSGSTP